MCSCIIVVTKLGQKPILLVPLYIPDDTPSSVDVTGASEEVMNLIFAALQCTSQNTECVSQQNQANVLFQTTETI